MKKVLFFLLFFPLIASAQFDFTHSQDGDFETISSHLFSDLTFSQLEANLFSDKAPPFANLRVFNGVINDSNNKLG